MRRATLGLVVLLALIGCGRGGGSKATDKPDRRATMEVEMRLRQWKDSGDQAPRIVSSKTKGRLAGFKIKNSAQVPAEAEPRPETLVTVDLTFEDGTVQPTVYRARRSVDGDAYDIREQ